MTKRGLSLKIGLIGATALTLPLIGAVKAGADYSATPYDYVGVGGDTPQFSFDFLANGDPDGDPGFNALGPKDRLVTFDAESDANGRAAYYGSDSGSNSAALQYPTDVLRDGENPTQRVSSSGNAITTLENDTSGDINFIFSSSGLSGSAYTVPLHEYEFGTDTVSLVASSTSVAPAAGLTDADLLAIYKTGSITNWDQITDVAGYTGPNAPIVALIPPSTSAITKTFEAAINAGSTFTVAGGVATVEQNDPTAITLLGATANDAIVPFSEARYNLLEGTGNTGGTLGTSGPYFPAIPGESGFLTAEAGIAYPAQPQFAPSIELVSSSATTTVTDYVDIRQSDLSDTSHAEPGASVNWAQYLFAGASGVTPYIDSGAAIALIKESGVTPVYADKGEFS